MCTSVISSFLKIITIRLTSLPAIATTKEKSAFEDTTFGANVWHVGYSDIIRQNPSCAHSNGRQRLGPTAASSAGGATGTSDDAPGRWQGWEPLVWLTADTPSPTWPPMSAAMVGSRGWNQLGGTGWRHHGWCRLDSQERVSARLLSVEQNRTDDVFESSRCLARHL